MKILLNGHSLREAQLAAWRLLLEGRQPQKKAECPFARYFTHGANGRSSLHDD